MTGGITTCPRTTFTHRAGERPRTVSFDAAKLLRLTDIRCENCVATRLQNAAIPGPRAARTEAAHGTETNLGFAAAVPLLAAFTTARANDHDQAVVTVQVSAADHELAEGYFSLGATVMASRFDLPVSRPPTGSPGHDHLGRERRTPAVPAGRPLAAELLEPLDHLADDVVGGRGAGGESDRRVAGARQPVGCDLFARRRPSTACRPGDSGSPCSRRGTPARRCGRSARASAQIRARLHGVAAVVAADHDHQVERLARRAARSTASCRSCVALQIVSNARKCAASVAVAVAVRHRRAEHLADLQRLGHQHRRLVGAADALEVDGRVEAGRRDRAEAGQERRRDRRRWRM